jgi:hypothetical protein
MQIKDALAQISQMNFHGSRLLIAFSSRTKKAGGWCTVEEKTMKATTGATMLVLAFLMSLTLSTSYAKDISSDTATKLLSDCWLEDDARAISTENGKGCCSFELGYCIECEESTQLGDTPKCVKVEIRLVPDNKISTPPATENAPTEPVIHDHRSPKIDSNSNDQAEIVAPNNRTGTVRVQRTRPSSSPTVNAPAPIVTDHR